MELRKCPLSEHEIITLINNRHHISLGSDTISPCLNTLEKDGLVRSRVDSGKRAFTLTECGEETVLKFLNEKARIMGLFLNLFVGE